MTFYQTVKAHPKISTSELEIIFGREDTVKGLAQHLGRDIKIDSFKISNNRYDAKYVIV
jgi:hypothetical protein